MYDWNYDGDKDRLPRFQFRSYTDFPFDNGAKHSLLFNYGDGGGSSRSSSSSSNSRSRQMLRGEEEEEEKEHPAHHSSSSSISSRSRRRRGTVEQTGRLSPEKAWLLREHLKGLYALLKAHPALMDRRLKVGSRKPDVPSQRLHHFQSSRTPDGLSTVDKPHIRSSQPLPAGKDGSLAASAAMPQRRPQHSSASPQPPLVPPAQIPLTLQQQQQQQQQQQLQQRTVEEQHHHQEQPQPQQQETQKRSFSHLTASAVCPARTEWRMLHVAPDINDTQVEVFQPTDGSAGHQWFYTTTCNYDYPGGGGGGGGGAGLAVDEDCPDCCRGVNQRRYHSRCLTRKSFVMALVRKQGDQQYDWNWIKVDTSCSCFISPA